MFEHPIALELFQLGSAEPAPAALRAGAGWSERWLDELNTAWTDREGLGFAVHGALAASIAVEPAPAGGRIVTAEAVASETSSGPGAAGADAVAVASGASLHEALRAIFPAAAPPDPPGVDPPGVPDPGARSERAASRGPGASTRMPPDLLTAGPDLRVARSFDVPATDPEETSARSTAEPLPATVRLREASPAALEVAPDQETTGADRLPQLPAPAARDAEPAGRETVPVRAIVRSPAALAARSPDDPTSSVADSVRSSVPSSTSRPSELTRPAFPSGWSDPEGGPPRASVSPGSAGGAEAAEGSGAPGRVAEVDLETAEPPRPGGRPGDREQAPPRQLSPVGEDPGTEIVSVPERRTPDREPQLTDTPHAVGQPSDRGRDRLRQSAATAPESAWLEQEVTTGVAMPTRPLRASHTTPRAGEADPDESRAGQERLEPRESPAGAVDPREAPRPAPERAPRAAAAVGAEDAPGAPPARLVAHTAATVAPAPQAEGLAAPPGRLSRPPAGAGEAPQRIQHQALAEAIVARARTLPGDGRVELRFVLDPPDLGLVHVRIESRGDEMTIRIVASTSGAAETLGAGISRLASGLGEAGVKAHDINVVLDTSLAAGGQSREEAPTPRRPARTRMARDVVEPASVSTGRTSAPRVSGSRLDLMA